MRRNLSGWVRQKPDHRDWSYTVPRRLTAALPSSVDLSSHLGPQLNQASLGSCGPFTAAECVEYDQRAENLPVVLPSPLFTYYNTRSLMGTVGQDSGVDNRSMLKALAQYGYCAESLWPYDVARFTVQPPQSCYAAALANRISSYAAVQQTLTQMKGCLASGFPFIFGFTCYPGLESVATAQTGIVPDPQPGERPIGGHDVTICGYDDAKAMFKFRNHWLNDDGAPWGAGGYGWISYLYATTPSLSGDFWVINAVPGGSPVPPPGPTPPSPPIPVGKLFSLRFPHVRQGRRVTFFAPTDIPPSTYDFVAETAGVAAIVEDA